MPGFNDLALVPEDLKKPELTAQWDHERNGGLRPEDVTGMSQRSVWWTGRCGHSWKAKISNRRNGCGCPYCCGKKILEGFNDAQSRCPELMDEWDFEKNTFLPSEITAGSQKDIWWRCRKGHSWKAKLPGRRRGNGISPSGAGRGMGLWEEPGIHTGDRHVPDPEESVVEMQERALLESGGL